MTAKEILAKIKAVFEGTTISTTAAATNVMNYNVDGGDPVYVDISDDGLPGIDTGDGVYADGALTVPYPDGTYTVTGTDFKFTVTSGVVTATEGSNVPVTTATATAPPATLPPQFSAMEKKIEKYEAEITQFKMELQAARQLADKHEKIFPDLFELVEKLTQLPASEPKTLTGRKQEIFNRQNMKEDKLNRLAENLRKLKET